LLQAGLQAVIITCLLLTILTLPMTSAFVVIATVLPEAIQKQTYFMLFESGLVLFLLPRLFPLLKE
jgi:hypothetical protein